MVDRSQIRSGMEVIAADGAPVGTVDQVDGEAIRLTRGADGNSGLVPLNQVDRVDAHVHLNVARDKLASLTGAAGAAAGATTIAGATATPASGDELPGPLPPVANPVVEGARPRGNYYLPWILGALLLLFLLFLLLSALDEGIDNGRDGDDDDRSRITETRRGDGSYAAGTIAGDLDRFLRSDERAPRTFTFDRLNFDRGSAAVRSTDVVDMDQLAQVLLAYPTARIAIIGYTDAEGSGRANAELGEDRADAVAEALAARGVSPERLETRSGGERVPLADNDRAEGRAENRRTELIVLDR
ncbi:OmpA family protein [Sphingosinicella sp. YJ22]|uniref:OmpA family protein n=1 Tax=Sphingosinicella sp. YJ22 TaxID=1104780 RepID=UPI00140D75E1|nr:OmpA family protein [Sphingosinicella sp. YJ22]